MTKPAILPEVLAALTERTPPRLLKKLDGAAAIAASWSWKVGDGTAEVTTDGGDRVSFTLREGALRAVEDVACSCLLAPRCFHIVAAASALDVPAALEPPATAVNDRSSEAASARRAVGDAEREAARRATEVLARSLTTGLSALGAVERSALLRVVHGARVAGLHRLASRTLTVSEHLRALRERSPSFDLVEATQALGDALATARRIERGDGSPETIGVARRAYETIGALRLFGIASEPVVTKAGFAGIVTYVADERGTLFTVDDVMPGTSARAASAYALTIRFGEASLTHAELSRAGLFVTNATASEDRRLGAGAAVAAVSTGGVRYDEPPVAALFAVPFGEQLRRVLDQPRANLGRTASLVFLDGTVVGRDRGAVLFTTRDADARTVRLVAVDDDPRFAAAENLRVLGHAVGAALLVVGRIAPERAGVVEAIAVAPQGGGLSLAANLAGRVNLAYDPLGRAQVTSSQGEAAPPGAPFAPMAALHRRVARMVLGGRRSLTSHHAADVAREAAALRASLAPTAAGALEALLIASEGARPRADDRVPGGVGAPTRLADAWLRAFTVVEVVQSALERSAWRDSAQR